MRRLAPALFVVLFPLALAACGGSSAPQTTGPKSTKLNPGPNSTATDPGPNNTANGPQTLQGTLVAGMRCVELDGNLAHESKTKFQLGFSGVTLKHKGAKVVLSGPDGDRTVGPDDTIYLAGHTEPGSGPCGRRFTVEKIVSVVPN